MLLTLCDVGHKKIVTLGAQPKVHTAARSIFNEALSHRAVLKLARVFFGPTHSRLGCDSLEWKGRVFWAKQLGQNSYSIYMECDLMIE